MRKEGKRERAEGKSWGIGRTNNEPRGVGRDSGGSGEENEGRIGRQWTKKRGEGRKREGGKVVGREGIRHVECMHVANRGSMCGFTDDGFDRR